MHIYILHIIGERKNHLDVIFTPVLPVTLLYKYRMVSITNLSYSANRHKFQSKSFQNSI